MRARRSLFPLLLAAALPVGGCTIIEKEYAVPIAASFSEFKAGETRCVDVVAALGPPSAISGLPEGAVVFYEYIDTVERQIGIGIIDWLKLSLGRASANREALALVFDREGRLVSQAWDERNEELGSGGSLELAVSVTSVVNTTALAEDFAPHGWAASMLRPLDRTLNAASSLQLGAAGLAQVGAPRIVGQHTLEWDR